ncbi:hypothetical protein Vadar_004172 [Vaccinium darrowii]|uniref:Uncharacterized protein n=1 Tax=Vaccinium darrowii TaxID=229202 RepID=A0ACB7ZAD1_9ERIC|nr:hypothetical protein Vadar_004172 [Vaccinium darrowii]
MGDHRSMGGSCGHDNMLGRVNYFDKCHSDELSIFELWHMARELGYEFKAIDFFVKGDDGNVSKIKSDAQVLDLSDLANESRVVKVYSVMEGELDNYIATQLSQCVDNVPTPPSKRTKKSAPQSTKSSSPIRKRTTTKTKVTSTRPASKRTRNSSPITKRAPNDDSSPVSKKTTTCSPLSNNTSVRPVVTSLTSPISGTTSIPMEIGDSDRTRGDTSDEYDPDSSSDTSDEDVFYDSDYWLTDDDIIFEENLDNDEDSYGLGSLPTHGAEYQLVIEELANIDVDCGSSDELESLCTSSNEDGVKPKKKHQVFNEKTDMANPVFMVGMEFKSHSLFRDAVKEYAIKHGKIIKFLKSDKEKARAVCKKGCPWE